MSDFPDQRYLSFFGDIRTPATDSFRLRLLEFVHEGAKQVTILFASGGGNTDDGRALFTFIRALPYPVVMHAVGAVSSMGIPVFLAARRENRLASRNSMFFFHQIGWDFGPGNVGHTIVKESDMLMDNVLEWQRDLIKRETNLTEDDLKALYLFQKPHIIDAPGAVKAGIAKAISEPSIPSDSMPRIACA